MTAQTLVENELQLEIVAAATTLGLDADIVGSGIEIDGHPYRPRLVERAHPTPAELGYLVSTGPNEFPAMVIADRISRAGKERLREAGWGWLDRRGHLRLWAQGLRVDVEYGTDDAPQSLSSNLWTTVGLEVCLAALIEPESTLTARRLAVTIGRSVGATHEMVSRFTEAGLIGSRTKLALLPELFWETAARWPDDNWVPLPVTLNELAARLGTTELVRVDERAATLAGAKIAAAGTMAARCYIPSQRLFRKARALSDAATPAKCWVRESPVNWLPTMAGHPPTEEHPWSVAHPIISALRLAKDPSRGQEIVTHWGIVPTRES